MDCGNNDDIGGAFAFLVRLQGLFVSHGLIGQRKGVINDMRR